MYDNLSGVMFIGCAHDEKGTTFEDRIFWSLVDTYAHNKHAPTSDLRSRWKNVVDWYVSTTAKFRKLDLWFPVWTYYQTKETVHTVPSTYFSFAGNKL